METYSLMMLVGGIILVVFGLVAIVNFFLMFKDTSKIFDGGFGVRMLVHLGAPFIAGLGGLSLVAGFIWFLLEKYR
jgi:hypothetical protein